MRERERDVDVGIICVRIYDDLALEAWTQRKEREREREWCMSIVCCVEWFKFFVFGFCAPLRVCVCVELWAYDAYLSSG